MTLPVLDLPGEPVACGRAHGEHFRGLIIEGMQRWRADLAAAGADPVQSLDAFLADRDFASATREWTPWLLDEVSGIAEGAGVDVRELWAYQLVDELWAFLRETVGARPVEHCSTLGILGQPTIVAQNLDLPASYDGLLCVLQIDRFGDRPATTVVTAAGVVGMTGVNDHGLAVGVNALPDVPSAPRGLPVAAVVRGALTRGSVDDASNWLAAVPHASGQNYVLGDPNNLADVECSATEVAELPVATGVVVHTNHALALRTCQRTESAAAVDSARRLDFLRAGTGVSGSDADALLALLDDITVPIRRYDAPGTPNRTCATIVYTCSRPPGVAVRGSSDVQEMSIVRDSVTA